MQFTSLVMAEVALSVLLGGADLEATFRCSALRPEGPGADPFLKDLVELNTWVWEKAIWGVLDSGWKMGASGAGGCLSVIISTVVLLC